MYGSVGWSARSEAVFEREFALEEGEQGRAGEGKAFRALQRTQAPFLPLPPHFLAYNMSIFSAARAREHTH